VPRTTPAASRRKGRNRGRQPAWRDAARHGVRAPACRLRCAPAAPPPPPPPPRRPAGSEKHPKRMARDSGGAVAVAVSPGGCVSSPVTAHQHRVRVREEGSATSHHGAPTHAVGLTQLRGR
jgi:hypothetical protein